MIHTITVAWVPNNHGYPYRATCSCGWQSNTYAAKHAAQAMGDDHTAESGTASYSPRTGDVVKLGPTAVEKHYVLHVWGDGTVQVRQNTTGKVRNVQAARCVLYKRTSDN